MMEEGALFIENDDQLCDAVAAAKSTFSLSKIILSAKTTLMGKSVFREDTSVQHLTSVVDSGLSRMAL